MQAKDSTFSGYIPKPTLHPDICKMNISAETASPDMKVSYVAYRTESFSSLFCLCPCLTGLTFRGEGIDQFQRQFTA